MKKKMVNKTKVVLYSLSSNAYIKGTRTANRSGGKIFLVNYTYSPYLARTFKNDEEASKYRSYIEKREPDEMYIEDYDKACKEYDDFIEKEILPNE